MRDKHAFGVRREIRSDGDCDDDDEEEDGGFESGIYGDPVSSV